MLESAKRKSFGGFLLSHYEDPKTARAERGKERLKVLGPLLIIVLLFFGPSSSPVGFVGRIVMATLLAIELLRMRGRLTFFGIWIVRIVTFLVLTIGIVLTLADIRSYNLALAPILVVFLLVYVYRHFARWKLDKPSSD